MAIIYRVETPEGFGPYSKIAPTLEDQDSHATPRREGIEFPVTWYFGFSELRLLTLWFSGLEIERLQAYGESWLLSKYEVPDRKLKVTATQAVFHRKSAVLLGCLPLSSLAGAERRELSAVEVEAFERAFEPHGPCEPRPLKGLFKEKRTVDLRSRSAEELLDSLEEGRYYYAQRYMFRSDRETESRRMVYRDRSLYPLREESFEALSLESVVGSYEQLLTFGAYR